jgi:hypothetical protein
MRALYLLILLTFCGCVFGQTPTYVDAKPSLEVTCPDRLVSVGDEFTVETSFKSVTGGTPLYEWSVSTGTIVAGQGTPSLRVRADQPGVAITAFLEIGGGPFWFEPLTETCTTGVASKPEAKLMSEFGVKNIGYVELMFDNFFAELWNDPSASGSVAISGPSPQERKRLKRWADRLIKIREFDRSRLTFVDSEKAPLGRFRIWMVPIGAEMPKMQAESGPNR